MAKPQPSISVQQEVARARKILASNDPEHALDDPYLVSTLYYSDSFLAKVRKLPYSKYPQNSIVANIASVLQPEFRDAYVNGLTETLEALLTPTMTSDLALPLDPHADFTVACGRACHKDALDIFTKEQSIVRSMSQGIVVLVDNGWGTQDQFATTSRKGGNAVIVFDPATKRFYRYCHLDAPAVKVRDIVNAGQAIGVVGHTGMSAARPGHGRHLHLEIHQYDEVAHTNRSLSRNEIISELEQIRRAAIQ
jgi:hypothetical protein